MKNTTALFPFQCEYSWKCSQMDQFYIFRASVSVHELFVPININGLHNKKLCQHH